MHKANYFLAIALGVSVLAYTVQPAATTSSPSSGDVSIAPGEYGGENLSAEQAQNAAIIIEVGRELGATEADLEIALATAYQESKLVNLDHGDRDSLGLFQQRPSQDWGTPEQIMDPRYAATAFFQGAGSNPGLLDVEDRSDPIAASHAVQRSAFPEKPGQWMQLADALVAASTATPSVEVASLTGAAPPLPVSESQEVSAGMTFGEWKVSRAEVPGDHIGVDLYKPDNTTAGTVVYAPISGKLTCQQDGLVGGRAIITDGARTVTLEHLEPHDSCAADVLAGDIVGKIASEATMGSASTGPHLHIHEVRNKEAVQPSEAMVRGALGLQ